MCVQCGKWIYGRCVAAKKLTRISIKFASRKGEGKLGRAVQQEEKFCDEVETIREFTYLGDRLSTSGGYWVSVTSRKKDLCVNLSECGQL